MKALTKIISSLVIGITVVWLIWRFFNSSNTGRTSGLFHSVENAGKSISLQPPSSHHYSPHVSRSLLVEKIDHDQLHNAQSAISKTISLFYHRYEYETQIGKQLFLTTNNIDEPSWNIIKYKLAHKIVSGNKPTFLMIFGGSSVTAGHDNYYNQSFPAVVERRMKHLFEAAGIELVVHNIAQGANNCVPYILCYESMGGLNPDFIGWEQVIQPLLLLRFSGVFIYLFFVVL
jgi:hypothetical protein